MAQKDDVFVAFRHCQHFQISDRFREKLLERLDQLKLQRVHFQSQVFKRDNQVIGSIRKSTNPRHIHKPTANNEPIAALAHHTVHIVIPGHSLDITRAKSRVDSRVNIFRKVVLEQLDALEHSLTQRKAIGLW